jgi:hypothetical protein
LLGCTASVFVVLLDPDELDGEDAAAAPEFLLS